MKTAIKLNQLLKQSLCPLSVAMTSALLLGVTALPSRADITSYYIFKTNRINQTSDAIPTFNDYIFSSQIRSNNSDDFTTAITTYDGPRSPLIYDVNFGSASYSINSSTIEPPNFYTSLEDFNTAFPDGSVYNFEVSGGILGTQTATLNSPSTSLYPSIPYLSGTTFSQLQGLNPANSFTLTWDGFSVPSGATGSQYFFIFPTSTGQVIFNEPFLAPNTTSLILPANTLAPNTNYRFLLGYINEIQTDIGFGDAEGLAFFERFTNGSFSTSSVVTPLTTFESSSLLGFGLLGLGFGIKKLKK